jgi:hypothetical protein
MRVLLDECAPRRLQRELPGHTVRTVAGMGWGGVKNGVLLQRAAADFDVFLTVDQNVRYQQNLSALPIPVIVLVALSNDIDVLRSLMPRVREILLKVQASQLYEIGA